MTNKVNDVEEGEAPITAQQLFDKLKPIHAEIETLEADMKELLDEAKEAELPYAMINSLAKAACKGKLGSVESKATKLLDLIEELTQ